MYGEDLRIMFVHGKVKNAMSSESAFNYIKVSAFY